MNYVGNQNIFLFSVGDLDLLLGMEKQFCDSSLTVALLTLRRHTFEIIVFSIPTRLPRMEKMSQC